MVKEGLHTPLNEISFFDKRSLLLIKKALRINCLKDFVELYPLRYQDRTKLYQISEVTQEMVFVQLKGRLGPFSLHHVTKSKKILTSSLIDQSGSIKLCWFNGAVRIQKQLVPGQQYILGGTPSSYKNRTVILHPEFFPLLQRASPSSSNELYPIYPLGAKLKKSGVSNRKWIGWLDSLLAMLRGKPIESLPKEILSRYKLLGKLEALFAIHKPSSRSMLHQARRRLKFEELFFFQLRILQSKKKRHKNTLPCRDRMNYNNLLLDLPFKLTAAQDYAIKEIYKDLASGRRMNRLLQGDVGSGKTIVSLFSMLPIFEKGLQVAYMVPTTILAQQHYHTLEKYMRKLHIGTALLTGGTRKKERTEIEHKLRTGALQLIIGTHALLEKNVAFQQLGMVIIDEQHRFGVAQRAQLWKKVEVSSPAHILVMTATPIPRTLAMTIYGDLDLSRINELPPGRLPIRTVHRTESKRLRVLGFLKEQVALGKQAYVIYPLVKESKKFDYKDVLNGYESLQRYLPKTQIGILYGGMTPEAKLEEMSRFKSGITKIMVATTVVEVGVDISNATTMVIENAERFGLSQLHQLRGRVGRGKEQSYCILMTPEQITPIAQQRMSAMATIKDGLELAKLDLKLRGAGNILGVEQSGLIKLKIADLAVDEKIVEAAHKEAKKMLQQAHIPTVITNHLALLERLEPNQQEVS